MMNNQQSDMARVLKGLTHPQKAMKLGVRLLSVRRKAR
jgi:hypothetical protein